MVKIDPLPELWLTRAQIPLDDYVVDMHTKRGRGKGKDRTIFAQEGSVVTNEWSGTDPHYKRIYENSKTIPGYLSELPVMIIDKEEKIPEKIEEVVKESEYLEFEVRAQLRLGGNCIFKNYLLANTDK